MPKVQSPKSADSQTEIQSAANRVEQAEVGRGTSDVGRGTLGASHGTLDVGLRVTDLRKSFLSASGERVEVLRGVSFSATAGEAVAITGQSGAGKSTLLHLLGGLEASDHGSIVADNFAVDHSNATALARWRNRNVGFVFQFHQLLSDLTAAENVSLPLLITRMSRQHAMQKALQMLEQFGIYRRQSLSLVGQLSGGEQQRVAVCRALITRPALVLADEPTGNLDAALGEEIARSIVTYARNTPALVILATHNAALSQICDRTLVLRDGRMYDSRGSD